MYPEQTSYERCAKNWNRNSRDMVEDYKNTSLEELLNLFDSATSSYYSSGEAIMPDTDFDELKDYLDEHYGDNPEVRKRIDGIYSDNSNSTESVTDKTVMISLKKIKWERPNAAGEVMTFLGCIGMNKRLKYAPKFDGQSIKVVVENGKAVQCLTRGGQDVTDKLCEHSDVLKAIENFPNCRFIHGELLIKKKVFEKYFGDGEEYSNMRNCVPGILKRKTPFEIDALLDFVPCTDGVNPLPSSVWKPLQTSAELYNMPKYMEQLRHEDFPYQVDGIVVGYDEPEHVQRVKDNYPLNLVACKFKNKSTQTTVIGIEWSQKKTGSLCPILLVQPTQLDGSTIQKVNGYNLGLLKQKHCGIGAVITITKTGDIIPVVCDVLKRSDNFAIPETGVKVSGKHLIAEDNEVSKIYKFILGLRLFAIDGIGPKIAETIGKCCNYDIVELFNPIHKPEIRDLVGGGAVWDKFQNFYNIKNLYLDQLIEMLQFNGCGKILSHKFALILMRIDNDIKGIDKTVLMSVCKGAGYQRIAEAQKKLATFGIKIMKPVVIDESTVTFEMTGSPTGMTKEQFVEKIRTKYPNAIHVTLTKTTKYLVVDSLQSTSGKANKARKYNIKLITYGDALTKGFQ